MIRIPVITFILLFFALACKERKDISGYGSVFAKIIQSEEELFRGFKIGDSHETIKLKETANLVDQDGPYYLYYDETLNETDFYNLSYNFDESGLYEIMMDATFDKKENADILFEYLKEYYSSRYGQPKPEDNYLIWNTNSSLSRHIEIALVNHKQDGEAGYVSLIFANYDY